MNRILTLICFLSFAGTTMMGQAYPDRHSTSYTDAWVSCDETESPNIKRDAGHWIMYNFGSQYSLHQTKVWNFNVPDSTSRGMRDVVIDYSNDGEDWTELGEYTIPEAPGSAFYQGDDVFDFEGVVARYVLITILNTHGDNNCAGMSEIKIDATIATSTNVPNAELDIDLVASPNPASEYTKVSIGKIEGEMQYSLTDMSGRLLRQGAINNTEFRLNTSTLTTGTYTLSINNQLGSKTILLNVAQ